MKGPLIFFCCSIVLYVLIGTFEAKIDYKNGGEDEGGVKTGNENTNTEVILVLLPPLKSEDDDDPTTNAGLFEGDIEDVNAEDVVSEGRNAIIAEHKKWPGRLIPYEIESIFNDTDKKIIASAMDEFHNRTCIRFVPRTKEQKDYIVIRYKQGCSSNVGKKGGEQVVTIGKGCLHRGIIIHELMHAIGFWHEQSRGDRDDHVTIIWTNIQEGRELNFQKYDWNSIQHLDEGYDLDSIMHYKPYAFAKNKKDPTIVPKDVAKLKTMGQRNGLSEVDVRKINKLYGCQTKAKGNECIDDKKKCILFSKRKYCLRYKEYMRTHCKKSCGFCDS